MLLTVVAALGVLTMLTITCLDVVLRLFRNPIVGTLDIVKIAGVITIAAALPYTTAIKGHVAIEYFFHKLSRTGRIIVDTFSRLFGLALFASLTWQSIQYAASLKHSGEVTPTLQIPIFWIPYVIAFSCAIVCLVVLYNLLHPGKEMIKP
ncbi:MAG: TRAP transporter small permease [Sedimentisphaerales bacterium]|nr:TRAP transporter small permease [Sedimentisphaerales bacterium]